MKLFKAFVLTSAILSCVGLANAGEVGVGGSDLFKFIDDTPEVISASNRTRVAQAGIKIAQAADAPNVSLNTLGSMWRHDSSNAPVGRGGVGETRYLDAQVVVSAPLYDFGVVEYSVDAAEARARAGGLRELQVKNNIAAEALSSLLEHQTASLKKQMYTKFLADVATLIELEEERYIAGFSTLSKVRELKLQYLDISTAADETVELSNRTRKLLERRFKGFDYERVPTVRQLSMSSPHYPPTKIHCSQSNVKFMLMSVSESLTRLRQLNRVVCLKLNLKALPVFMMLIKVHLINTR